MCCRIVPSHNACMDDSNRNSVHTSFLTVENTQRVTAGSYSVGKYTLIESTRNAKELTHAHDAEWNLTMQDEAAATRKHASGCRHVLLATPTPNCAVCTWCLQGLGCHLSPVLHIFLEQFCLFRTIHLHVGEELRVLLEQVCSVTSVTEIVLHFSDLDSQFT